MPTTKFMQIMLFYAILACFLMPFIFYFFIHKSDRSAGNGFVLGSILSIMLWYSYGSKMV